ncbi:hypothetical protein SHKM778_26730 [Streptomyces sp. KM77-8]|uniref:Tetratricopeptide repeat protein n=1 Tax=Streptomyces haneummycinicus TaxID=3074435 RepID=A0AAT9HG42_9ACTN
MAAAQRGPGHDGRTPVPARPRPWPDVRTQVFARPPADPRTPDEHLAAGNTAAALAGYDDGLAREPGDPHLLAGRLVARAAAGRGPGDSSPGPRRSADGEAGFRHPGRRGQG